jgi:lysophospholipase L1-like esterase
MGSGVLEEQRYSDQLQDLLNADGSGRYEVMNTALNGLNIYRGVQRLGLMLPRYRADLFVFGFSPNDIEGENYETRVENLEESGRIWAWALRNYNSPFYLWRLFTLRAAMMLTESALHSKSEELRYNYLENEAAWADFVRGLEDFAELTRKHGVCGHVLIHTYLDRLGDDHPYLEVYDLVERTARAKGLTVTQTFPIFEGLRADRLWVTQFDRHPSPEGHAMLAEVLYEDLKQLPPRCWQRR